MSALPADAPAEMFRAALDALPEPVFVYDDSHVLYANQASCDALRGSSVEDVLGMDVSQFVLPGFDEISSQRRTYVLRGGIHLRNLVVKIRGLDGEPLTFRVNIRQISFEGRTAAMSTLASLEAAPVRPSKAAERGTQGKSLYEAALAAIDMPLLVHGSRSIYFANPAALEVLNVARADQLVGSDITTIVHQDGAEAGHERRKLVLEKNQTLPHVPVKLRTVDGRTLYAVVNAQRIEWNGGTGILIVASFPDTSE